MLCGPKVRVFALVVHASGVHSAGGRFRLVRAERRHAEHVTVWKELGELARAQHLAVSLTQAVAVGLPARTVQDQLERRAWRRVYENVYALPGARPTFEFQAHAALLMAGERAALSGPSAAYVWGLWRRQPGRIDIVIPYDRRVRDKTYVTVHRSRTLQATDVTVVHGLRVATVPRTLCECAAAHSSTRLADLVVMALQLRLVTAEEVVVQAERMGRIKGKGRLLAILAELPRDETDSGFERRVRQWLRGHGFEPDAEQVLLIDEGRVIGKVDVPFSSARVGIACDGRWTHLLPSQQRRDRAKDNAAAAMGWILLHLLEDEFDDGSPELLRQLRRLLNDRCVERNRE